MGIRVYNTLTKEKERFETIEKGKVGIYLCGPTVYKPCHIGHAVGPIIFDVIKRYLTHRGYTVTMVVNITDVDDKLIDEAAVQETTVSELAARMTENYLSAMAALGIDTIDHMPKAVDHIGDIIKMIERLIARDAAYAHEGSVYFDVTADADYGKLSNRKSDDQQSQRDVEGGHKRHAGDFALWKAAKPHEPVEVRFDSPWGPGRPGWHIECSAMSVRYLGETFDIHGGGMDLIFPHHENEIAQSETAHEKPFAKYWMHHGLTRFNTKKVSKSDANMADALKKMTLSRLLEDHGGELIRYFVLSTHYRRPIEFSDAEIESKRRGLSSFHRLFDRIARVCGKSPYDDPTTSLDAWEQVDKQSCSSFAADVDAFVARFFTAMDDDFNTAAAIASMFECATRINRFIEESGLESTGNENPAGLSVAYASVQTLMSLGRLHGLFSKAPEAAGGGDELVEQLMQILIAARSAAREAKQFGIGDMIRDELSKAGVTLEDRTDGTLWRR